MKAWISDGKDCWRKGSSVYFGFAEKCLMAETNRIEFLWSPHDLAFCHVAAELGQYGGRDQRSDQYGSKRWII